MVHILNYVICILDPDLLSSRLEAQDKRTQHLQEKYNKDAEKLKEKLEQVREFLRLPLVWFSEL